ncbi:unnamed protein product [Orchesella dallaii]|uniref:ODAD1 central coiled coil region domain-containing protein n=1 Tax=Orchesella dallaii TaxID=48710 RepID=A0ABP1Q6K1_9HEXA
MVGRSGKTDGGGTAESGEDNTEMIAREECTRLARQLRLMENDKMAYLDESNAAIAQQKKAITALEDENKAIEEELHWYTTKRNEVIERSNWEKVEILLHQYLSMEAEVKEQTRIISEVERKLASTSFRATKLENKIEMTMQQSEMSKLEQLAPAAFDSKEFLTKKKLETVTSQFDSVVAENSELRSGIDKLLQENMGIMKRCQNLEHISAKNQAQIDELVDEATAAYDQREEAVAKANALRDRNEKEKKQFVLEINELNRVIRHEEKLLDFMNTKNKDRLFLETEDERQSRLESAKEQTMDETLEMYRESLSKLLTKDSPTFQSLVEEYRDLWNQNITRFNYINELGNELEELQASVEILRGDMKECSTETVGRNQQKNDAIVQQQAELSNMKLEYVSVQQQMSTVKEFVDEIVELIEKLFKITDFADSKPVLELLGNHQQISEKTAMLFVSILEHRIADLFAFRVDRSRSGLSASGRATPKSPRYSKSVSEFSLPLSNSRPMIVLDRMFSDSVEGSENGETAEEMIDSEANPLGYLSMRGKVLDSVSLKSNSDNESIISNSCVIVQN